MKEEPCLKNLGYKWRCYKLHRADYNITLLKALGSYTVLEFMVISADALLEAMTIIWRCFLETTRRSLQCQKEQLKISALKMYFLDRMLE